MKRLSPNRDEKIRRRRMRMIRSSGYPSKWPAEIAKAQGWQCHYCKRHMTKHEGPRRMTLDHLVPVSRGGLTRRANLVAACETCNTAKGNKTEAEFSGAGDWF